MLLFQCEHCICLVQLCPRETPGECRRLQQLNQAQRIILTGPTSTTCQLLRALWRTRSDRPPVQCPLPQANFRPFPRRGHVCCSMMDFLTMQHVKVSYCFYKVPTFSFQSVSEEGFVPLTHFPCKLCSFSCSVCTAR